VIAPEKRTWVAGHWDGHLAAHHTGHVDGSFCGQGLLVADDYACAPLHATRALRLEVCSRACQELVIRSAAGLFAIRMYIGHRGARRDVRVGLVEGVSIVLGEGVGPPLSKNGTRITTMLTRVPNIMHALTMTMNRLAHCHAILTDNVQDSSRRSASSWRLSPARMRVRP